MGTYAFIIAISSIIQINAIPGVNHHDTGVNLCFEYNNYDDGLQYIYDDRTVSFPFHNCSGQDLIIDRVQFNKPSKLAVYNVLYETIRDTIYAGERDTLKFKKRTYTDWEPGLYDNSWTITFKNSHIKQHLNIFCELEVNQGRLAVNPLNLERITRGEIIEVNPVVRNFGDDPVTIFYSNHWNRLPMKAMDSYPLIIDSGQSKTLDFELETSGLLNEYQGILYFTTNEKSGSNQLKVEYAGKLISVNHPSIKFDSTVITKHLNSNGPGQFDFWFTNNGDAPLLIANAKTSCGCLVATWPREPISPGERGVIKVKYDTKRIGPINKSITVKTNAADNPIILRVKGNVTRSEPKN